MFLVLISILLLLSHWIGFENFSAKLKPANGNNRKVIIKHKLKSDVFTTFFWQALMLLWFHILIFFSPRHRFCSSSWRCPAFWSFRSPFLYCSPRFEVLCFIGITFLVSFVIQPICSKSLTLGMAHYLHIMYRQRAAYWRFCYWQSNCISGHVSFRFGTNVMQIAKKGSIGLVYVKLVIAARLRKTAPITIVQHSILQSSKQNFKKNARRHCGDNWKFRSNYKQVSRLIKTAESFEFGIN